ncbi:hypothetical protein GQS_08005 [Thermococcus sp. 4557]|uniref:hypothetical protein n=1 Tax=Thermococcus sp. (strain CGMCC 1.5172 / 4557) TaxID=1042877 RepID=UPI000219ED1D|nr:hypothetical protein [Thermococcus sp. 4557]AEK73497.1 hypothetical protein GQS_08005 [Thermococcus sp. 4557]
MKHRILLGVLLVGGLFVGLVNAAGSVSTQSCWTPWDHNSDVREWSQDEWVWAGIHGQVLVCNGKFQKVLTDTVWGTTEGKGVKILDKGIITDPHGMYAYSYVYYRRYNGEKGRAKALIPNYFR